MRNVSRLKDLQTCNLESHEENTRRGLLFVTLPAKTAKLATKIGNIYKKILLVPWLE